MINWCNSRRHLKRGSIVLALFGLLLSSPAFACVAMAPDGAMAAMQATVQHDAMAMDHDAMPTPDDGGLATDCCATCPAGCVAIPLAPPALTAFQPEALRDASFPAPLLSIIPTITIPPPRLTA